LHLFVKEILGAFQLHFFAQLTVIDLQYSFTQYLPAELMYFTETQTLKVPFFA
jgi:hypothetical protein